MEEGNRLYGLLGKSQQSTRHMQGPVFKTWSDAIYSAPDHHWPP